MNVKDIINPEVFWALRIIGYGWLVAAVTVIGWTALRSTLEAYATIRARRR